MDTCPLCHLRTDLNYHVCLHGIRKSVIFRPGQTAVGPQPGGFVAQNLPSSTNINVVPAFLRFPLASSSQALPPAPPIHQMYNIINPGVPTCFLPTQHSTPYLITSYPYTSLGIVNNIFGNVASPSPLAVSQSSLSRMSFNQPEPSTSKNLSYSFGDQSQTSSISSDHIEQNFEGPSNLFNVEDSLNSEGPLAAYYSQQNLNRRTTKKEYPTLHQYSKPSSSFVYRDNSDSNEEALDLSDHSAQRSLANLSPKRSHSELVALNFSQDRNSSAEQHSTDTENIVIKAEPLVTPEKPSSPFQGEEQPVNYGAGPSRPVFSSTPRSANISNVSYELSDDSDDEICSLESSDSEHDSVDITKKDLLATENLEDNDDDQYYSNPLQSFVNLQPNKSSVPLNFYCRTCFTNFPTHTQLSNHVCSSQSRDTIHQDSTQFFMSAQASTSIKTEETQQINENDLDTGTFLPIKLECTSQTSQTALGSVGSGNWKCDKCYKSFTSSTDLSAHHKEILNSKHKCVKCHLVFTTDTEKITHQEEVHLLDSKTDDIEDELNENASGEFVCNKCDRAFKTRDMYTKHQACHNEEKPFECLRCGKKFIKLSLLRGHQKTHFKAVTHKCFYCDKTFHAHTKLLEHERIHTGEAPLTCPTCGKSFKRHSNLSEHRRTHQAAKAKPLRELFCHCGQVFHNQRDLDWHKEGVHSKVPQKCKHCGEVFVHSSSLTRHIRLKHETSFVPTDKKASLYDNCPMCGKTFYKTSINKHIRIKHEGIKQFECEVCKMTFVTKSNLANHAWQHKVARSRPFKCTLCSKAFLRQVLLDNHIKMHRGIKSFVCNECGLQFANKSNLQRHVREHTGTRSFTCTLCSKKFARHYYLTDHMKTHTGERPYVCGICGKGAATRSNYNSHMQTHISREPMHPEI